MKLAIIGASIGQLPLCLKAKEMGITTICFAWEKGAYCKDYVDTFYPISVKEVEKIIEVCKNEKVDGVLTNASEMLGEITAYISEKLNLYGNPYNVITKIRNKKYVREQLVSIKGLSQVKNILYTNHNNIKYPCVVKPVIGAAKKGVFFVHDESMLSQALDYVQEVSKDILIEEYIEGREVSVESISFEGKHYVLQITDKDNSGYPHFVELGHHQPANIVSTVREKIEQIVINILQKLNFQNGASHIELRIDNEDNIYLIEVNPRGGGDNISSQLVRLSTGYDYIRGMIEVALGIFQQPIVVQKAYSGIYYLCQQTKEQIDFFKKAENHPWLIEKNISSYKLHEATGNHDRNGYFIYNWWNKVLLNNRQIDLVSLNTLSNKEELAKNFIDEIKREDVSTSVSYVWLEKILRLANIYCIIVESKIVAWIVIYCNNYQTKVAYCAGLHVLKEYRQKGFAQSLLQTGIFKCSQLKFKELTLYCNNPIAEHLYVKNGFRFVRKEVVKQLQGKEYNFLRLAL